MIKTSKIETGHYYNLFGLTLYSKEELTELVEIESENSKFEIIIEFCEFKQQIGEEESENLALFKVDRFYLNIKNVAKYLVIKKSDRTIIKVDSNNKSNILEVKPWLYGSVFTIALQYNNRFAFHASANVVNKELVLFCGPSGIGKSTLASQLHTKGYTIFSDDKCVLTWNNNKGCYYAETSIQILRLWNNSINVLSDQTFIKNQQKIHSKEGKFQYELDSSKESTSKKKVKAIFQIQNTPENSSLKIFEPDGLRKITRLRNQVHRMGFVRKIRKVKILNTQLMSIAEHIPYYVILRPKNTSISSFIDFVEQQLLKLK